MNRVPKLRFKEFTNELKEIKFKDFLNERKDIATEKEELYSLTIEKGVTPKEERYERDFLVNNEKDAYKIVLKNDFVYNPMNIRFGAVAQFIENKNVKVSKYYNIFYCNNHINSYFFEKFIKTKRMFDLYNKLATGSLNEKKRLHFTDFLEIKQPFPCLEEQEKIGNFLSSVDKKISITEEKLDLFKEYKKGIMQKIFKQELRFKDSNDNDYPEWEEKILGNIIIKNKEKNKENKYNLVQSISNKYGFVNQDEYFEDRRVASQDLKNYYVAKNKLFAYNPSRINVGSLAYKEDNNISVISPLYVSFYSNKEYLIDKFLFNWLFSLPFVKQMSCSFEGSVRNNLSFETLSNFTINLPCLEEQEKIANFLSSIDNKIDSLAAELENLKEFKKGLLQQMFV